MLVKTLKTLLAASLNMSANSISAQDNIQLPSPIRDGGMPLSEALSSRHSTREFDPSKPVDKQLLSNLLWSANGINRPSSGHRTNPTALNSQEIDVYLIDKSGAYLYDATSNSLQLIAEGDHRGLVAGTAGFSQDFVNDAPISLVIVGDYSKFDRDPDQAMLTTMCDAGIVCQNINLFCSANGLATVPRMTMDTAGLAKVLKLKPTQRAILNNPIGYAR